MAIQDINNKVYLGVFFVFGLIEVLVCSGITYGWASIVYVFKVQYFYMNLCKSPSKASHNAKFFSNITSDVSTYEIGDDGLPGCLAQDSMFNLIFTCAVFFFTSVQFPTGMFIDKFGPRVGRYIGGTMYALSCLALGFIDIGYEWLLFPVFTIICIGGGMLSMTVYQASNIIFRQHRSKVICILHGAFDSSAVMLLIFKVIYDHGVDYKRIMIGYTIFCALLNLFGTFLMIPAKKVLFGWSEEEKRTVAKNEGQTDNGDDSGPDFMHTSLNASYNMSNKKPTKIYIPSSKEDVENKGEEISMEKVTKSSFQTSDNGAIIDKEDEDRSLTDDEIPLVETKMPSEDSVWKSISSPLYLFELVYVCTFQLKLWYMVGALAEDLIRLTNNDKNMVSDYIDIFGYIQFGGIFITPIIGFVFDKSSFIKEKTILITSPERAYLKRLSECILPFALTGVLSIILCIVSTIQNLKLQVFSFILYMVVRGFLYSSHGAYIGAAFPASQFGTLYGFGIFIAGVFGTLQYALFQFKSGPLNGDPLWVNLILSILVIIGNFHPIYLWWHCRRENKRLNAAM